MTPRRMTIAPGIEAVLPRETVTLPDGTTGYYQLSNDPHDGCLAAALATCLQIPLADIDLRGPAKTTDARDCALRHGFECEPHHLAAPLDSPRWVGLTPGFEDAGGLGHCLVMSYGRVLFDPASGWQLPPRFQAAPTTELVYGLTFQRMEER